MKVTFDSNVWQPVCNPKNYENDPSFSHFMKIKEAISQGIINAYLAETIFTLESIKKKDRQATLSDYKPKISIEEDEMPNETVQLIYKIAQDQATHPSNNTFLEDYLNHAIRLGFKILPCTRVGGFKNLDLKDNYFLKQDDADFHATIELTGRVAREIENRGAGISIIKTIGARYSTDPKDWLDGIHQAPKSEEKAIAKAFAEWADGDSIATHIGHGIKYYCTRDQGKSSGRHSILAKENRAWLENTYEVLFVTPDELSALLA